MNRYFCIFTFVLSVLLVSPIAHADITGKPRIVDGDMIRIGKTKIRLHGINAPEMKQTCRTSEGNNRSAAYWPSKPLNGSSGVRMLPARVTSEIDTNA
jgi:hypothetical protein